MDGVTKPQSRKGAAGLYRAAAALWGTDAQWRMVQEECAELIAAVSRLWRNREGAELDVISELADVEIMCEQARAIVGDVPVDEARAIKLRRLRDRVEAAGGVAP